MDRFHAATTRFQPKYGMDCRFVQLTLFMCLLVWPWLVITTFGVALLAWQIVLSCQAIALPFSVLGWAAGFRAGHKMGFQPRWAAMVAGWSALFAAEAGLALILRLFLGPGSQAFGLWALPSLMVQVTVGVLWLYRADTWPRVLVHAEGAAT
jgi:hypothetical protein